MFGKRLTLLRCEKGITQQQLADLMEVGCPTIAGYETKGTQPDFENLFWLSSYFNVSTDYLFGISDRKNEYHSIENTTKPIVVTREDENPITYHSEDIDKVLNYYKRLDDENKDYIKGQMIQLYKEQAKSNFIKTLERTG